MTENLFSIYNSTQEVLNALSQYPAGSAERRKILENPFNRQQVLSTGTSMVLYVGETIEEGTPVERLKKIYVGLIDRLNAKTGEKDGVGNLGGLSERTKDEDFLNLTVSEKENLIGVKDDLIRDETGEIVLTKDLSVISRNNVLREAKEELGNIGVGIDVLRFETMIPVPLNDVKDDNYILNRWNGCGVSYAISPCAYLVKTQECILDEIVSGSQKNLREFETEVAQFRKVNLTHALSLFGKPNSNRLQCNEIRDMASDYRYPHEWLSAWYLASVQLNHRPEDLKKLAVQIQQKTPYLIDFEQAGKEMKLSSEKMATILGISSKDMTELITSVKETHLHNAKYTSTKPYTID